MSTATPPLVVTGAERDGVPTELRAEDGVITHLGPEVPHHDGDVVIEGSGCALVEPMVNGHTHAAMTLLRGHGDDLALMEWLQTAIWPAEARLDADTVRVGTALACLEMVRSGTARCWDMYFHPEAVAEAVAASGLRATVAAPFFDFGDAAKAAEMRAVTLDTLDRTADVVDDLDAADRIEVGLAPHAVYTVSEASLVWLAETAADRGLSVQIHLAETAGEVHDCVEASGVRPLALVERAGLLGPDTVLAHGCWLDEAELEVVAAAGATVVTNPVSNMKLAVGRAFPWVAARRAGVPVGLGTDGAASNNGLDLFADLKTFALLTRHDAVDATALTASDALDVARGLHAPRLGGHRLAVGGPADVLLVRTDEPDMRPGDLDAALVYVASGDRVDTTIVAGQVLMSDRMVQGAAGVVEAALEASERLLASVD